MGSAAEEFRATPKTTAQVHSTDGLGGKPLAVVSAGEQPTGWLELQDERRGAQVCSAAILEVVETERNDQPLRR